ncbi:hypothetical protein [Saccharicrinis sp. FJH54]|uniref:hypothetical protein n=1 Tax=Saccharicrinis sp. FJH54 TaxID=3344665 RepID=UPI0035D481CC
MQRLRVYDPHSLKHFMKIYGLLLLCLASLMACEKSSEGEYCYIDPNQYDIVIKTGTFCGWCAGADSLLITSEIINYGWKDPCDNNDIFKSFTTDSADFEELINLLNYDEFKLLDLNSCNVCADGCDTWIEILMDNKSHYIRFGYRDTTAIAPILPLVNKLSEIKASLHSQL